MARQIDEGEFKKRIEIQSWKEQIGTPFEKDVVDLYSVNKVLDEARKDIFSKAKSQKDIADEQCNYSCRITRPYKGFPKPNLTKRWIPEEVILRWFGIPKEDAKLEERVT